MAARSIASLSLSFGLVSIPVKLYSATEPSSGVRFNMLSADGARLKQQYVSERDGSVVERSAMVKGYEFEKDRYVLFTNDELKALQEARSQSIDIIAFVPAQSIDPLFYDKAYFLAPDKRGAKPYTLLLQAMKESGRCALARWAWRGKQYMVQVRPDEEGIVLQQLLYADEVRSLKDLDIEIAPVTQQELKLALQFIDQISEDGYQPADYEDEEKKRILAAIDGKIAGREIVVQEEDGTSGEGAQVIDLMEALKASLGAGRPRRSSAAGSEVAPAAPAATGLAASPAPAGKAARAAAAEERATHEVAAQAGASTAGKATRSRRSASAEAIPAQPPASVDASAAAASARKGARRAKPATDGVEAPAPRLRARK